ncbi:MAG: DNA primase, partial [Burkholderiales bacterium]|nr:DNA primase [Burkholderiales bacterium]
VGPADQALRLLLRHSEWWERLAAEDHELLHHLPEPHGPLSNWLERQLHEHGPLAWGALREGLGDELRAAATGLMDSVAVDDVVEFDDLRRVINLLWRRQLKERGEELARLGDDDPQARRELLEVHRRLQALDNPAAPVPREGRSGPAAIA